MQIRLETSPIDKLDVDALAVIGFEPEDRTAGIVQPDSNAVAPQQEQPDPDIAVQAGWMSELRSSGEFTGKLYEIVTLHRPQGLAAKRLAVIGGGKKSKLSTVETRRLAGALVRSLQGKGVRKIALLLEGIDAKEHAAALMEGALLGAWEADKYKSDPKKHEKQMDEFALVTSSSEAQTLKPLVDKGRIIAEAQNRTRDLVNEPPNKLFPETLAEAAREMCQEFGLQCEVLDENTMRDLGMGALLGVAQGSSKPPFLIAIKYRPALPVGEDHLALVGKGVTFDTGGISIKLAEGMDKMKYDMAGAAAVMGAMQAIAQLKPSLPVTGYIPTVENMLNGNALRPGDIVTSLAGKTIEVLNTDAEGRLILADAITYARRDKVTHIVDAATLTGAIGIALGHHNMGAFTNNQRFFDLFLAASRTAGEKSWQLPMDEEYKDYLKSAFADLPNIGGRHGGSITAAWFLREFADPIPWVHLDIAATAWLDDAKPWLSKGPTGVAMRSFVQLALDWPLP